jgi:hypothetical protein
MQIKTGEKIGTAICKELVASGSKSQKDLAATTVKTDMALNLAQLSQLESSARCLVVKNEPLQGVGDKETYMEKLEAANKVMEEIGVSRLVTINSVQRLQKRADVGSDVLPNLRIQIAGEGMRKMVFEAVEVMAKDNSPPPYIFAADIPAYAKKKFKEMNALGKICRDRNLKTVKTRVLMRNNWPHLFTKRANETRYSPASDELIQSLREARRESFLTKPQKRKADPAKPMEVQQAPEAAPSAGAAAGSAKKGKAGAAGASKASMTLRASTRTKTAK